MKTDIENLNASVAPATSPRCGRPPLDGALPRSHNKTSLTLTPCSQTKVIVANCRRSKIQPTTYTLNLNTRNAGLQTGKSPAIPTSSLSLNTLGSERGQPVRFRSAATAVQHHTRSLQRVAPGCTVLQRVAPKIFCQYCNGTAMRVDAKPLIPFSSLLKVNQGISSLKNIIFGTFSLIINNFQQPPPGLKPSAKRVREVL